MSHEPGFARCFISEQLEQPRQATEHVEPQFPYPLTGDDIISHAEQQRCGWQRLGTQQALRRSWFLPRSEAGPGTDSPNGVFNSHLTSFTASARCSSSEVKPLSSSVCWMASRINVRCLRMVPKAALSGVVTGRKGVENPSVNYEHHSGLWNSLHLFSINSS